MSITSSRTIQVEYSGDVTLSVIQSALDNAVSSGETDFVTLAIGDNTIADPVISGIVNTGLLIIPPSGNTTLITLKGDAADIGIPLHKTDPTSLAIDSTMTSLILNVATAIPGVRLIWT